MAKNLKDYRRKEIRCLMIEDFETGELKKITKQEDIEKALLQYTDNEITKIYNPTQEQIKKINDLIERKVEEEKIYSKIEGIDMLINVIPMLTDIEIDLDKEEDIALINEIIEDPNDVFNEVVLELNKIIMNINLNWIEGLKILNKLPDEIVNALAENSKSDEING
ncbi:hypothetical protein [Clostridium sp.]|uniref:hypothetical protein n=1 Tax=Clostridium sp. TaxID=1506 RepID=UPI001E12DC6F|nr:hypothetical protein [Clostridium sp.]MBS5307789.1 hypothetical protein [Clostridium sp.]